MVLTDVVNYDRDVALALLISLHLFLHVLFLADRTNGRAIGTVFRLSVCRLSVVVCNVMYCG